jgi:phosphoribosylglycinamide formyltransferase-1
VLSVVVLISGTGSNLLALLEAAAEPGFPARIVAVGADREAEGLAHAERFGIPTFVVAPRDHPGADGRPDRDAWGDALLARVQAFAPGLVVLSGLMRLLPAGFVGALAPNLVNTHPAYLPEFPGAHAVRDALAAAADDPGVTETGASIIVVDEGVDSGPIIARERVPILPGDDEAALHERIKPVERRLLIQAVGDIAEGRLDLKEL